MIHETFSRTATKWLAVVGGFSLFAGIVLGIFQSDFSFFVSPGTNSYSKSILGHKAFVELLKKVGFPVVVSTYSSGAKSGPTAVLIIAEPLFKNVDDLHAKRFMQMIEKAQKRFIVLPKWIGKPDYERPEWLREIDSVPDEIKHNLLKMIGSDATIVHGRSDKKMIWKGIPSGWQLHLDKPQLMVGKKILPLIYCEDGVLAGELVDENPQTSTLLLSDPDLIANIHLRKGDNARIVLDVLESLRTGKGGIIIDETLHGFELRRSPFRLFFQFPLLLVLISLLLVAGTLVWISLIRFGKAIPVPDRICWGKGQLIANTAGFLLHNNRHAFIIEGYYDNIVKETIKKLHIGCGFPSMTAVEHLDRIAEARGAAVRLKPIAARIHALQRERRPAAGDIRKMAWDLYQWRKEMLYGPWRDARICLTGKSADTTGCDGP